MRQLKIFLRSNINVKLVDWLTLFLQRFCRYQGLHYLVVRLVVFILITFITPLHFVAAMDQISIERIGDVHTGLVENAGGLEKINDPKLLVLSTPQGEPQVLYCSRSRQEGGNRSITFTYHIDFLPLPNSQGKSGSLFDDYPITYKGKVHNKIEVRTVEAIDLKTIQIGDITGDGADELLFATDPGGLEVYGQKKSLFKYKPDHFQPEIYQYDVVDIQKSFSGAKDGFLYVLSRQPYEADNLSVDEKRFYSSSESFLIMLVNDKGVTRIRPKVNLQRGKDVAVVTVFAAGAISLPASKTVSGLVLCGQIAGKAGVYSVSYDLDGFATDEPKKIMETVEKSDQFHYFFSPQSANVWLLNRSNDELFTYELGSDEGQVHSIDTAGTTPLGTLSIPGTKDGEALLFLDSSKKFVYAVGSQGEYFILEGDVAIATRKKTPYLHFTSSSSTHVVHDVAWLGKKQEDKFLLVESRQPQFKEVSDDELIAAGKKYLSDDDYEDCSSEGQLQFNDLVRGEANYQSKQRGLGLSIESLEDLKKNLPDVYERFSSEARNDYIDSLRIWLLTPISREELAGSDFKQKEEYYTWLQNQSLQAEMILTLMDIRGKVMTRKAVGDYFQPEELLADSDISLPAVQYVEVEGRDLFFMALKSGTAKEELASYYLIQ